MIELLAHLVLLAFDPSASSVVAAWMIGEPQLSAELVAICHRESHCAYVGAHPADAWAGRVMRKKALERGWLDGGCDWHHGAPERFSTRGVHGMSAAYSLRHLGGCLPPEVLDVPLVSALAAARRAQAQCESHGACTAAARHRLWIGAGRWDRAHRRKG